MFTVYIIKSFKDGTYYTGVTENFEKRLREHNMGQVQYTSARRPFVAAWYSLFLNKEKAFAFERYLKSGSGIAFRNKHLL